MPRASKPSQAETKPYAHGPTDGDAKVRKVGQRYDKKLLVALVLKTAVNVDWDGLSAQVGKTPTQCKDVWRKVLNPALVTNKPWSTGGVGWTEEMKCATLTAVLDATNPDWEAITAAFEGKTKSQLHDVWRKVILPRLKKGMTVE